MRKAVLLSTAIMLFAATFTLAEAQEDKKLGVTFDLTYMSKWMSKGSEGYGQQGALFKTIDVDWFGTGFGVKVTHRNATASGYVDKQRFDYRPYYKNQMFKGTRWATNYNISAGYEHYPGLARNVSNTTWEWIYAFSWPNILKGGLVPSYIAHYEYPAGRNYDHHDVAGWVHRFGLGYDLEVVKLANPLHLSAEIAYRNGLGGPAKDHDWSHATFGISTNFKLNDRLSFVPGLYYQESMDDSVCKRDVIYCKLSLKYRF